MSKLSKDAIAKLLSRELVKLTDKEISGLHRMITTSGSNAPIKAIKPKTQTAGKTSNGKMSHDILDIRRRILASWNRIS